MKLMKKVDEFLFKSCDELKKSPTYQKITDLNSSIDDESRPSVNFLVSLAFFGIPFVICLIFFIDNQSLISDIETKESIYDEVTRFSELKKRAEPLFSKLVANPKINSQEDFVREIKATAGTIVPTKITVKDFSNRETTDGLSVVSAKIQLNGIHNEDLSLFIQNLNIQKKIQFLETEIIKSKSTDLLNVKVEVMQFSR